MTKNYGVAKYVNHKTQEFGVTVRDINADKSSRIVYKNIMYLTHDAKQDDKDWTIDFLGLDRYTAKNIKEDIVSIYKHLAYKQVTFLEQKA
jgi:hypothetical protein